MLKGYICNLEMGNDIMNKIAGRIADAELEVMRELWDASESVTVSKLRLAVVKKTGWDGSTVKTLLYRLQKKGVVKVEKREVFHYSPTITEEEYNKYSTKKMIDRLFHGSAKSLVASLVETNMLSDKDIDELRRLFWEEKDE